MADGEVAPAHPARLPHCFYLARYNNHASYLHKALDKLINKLILHLRPRLTGK